MSTTEQASTTPDVAEKWDQRYREGDLPWEAPMPDRNLVESVAGHPILPGTLLELGCGTGCNAVWLAEQGFAVTVVDISEVAIGMARERFDRDGVHIRTTVSDIVRGALPKGPFDAVFDRGCFHSISDASERREAVANVASVMRPGGLWLSLLGSCDGPEREAGPPQRSATEIVVAVERDFEILELAATVFHSDQEDPPRAWRLLMRRRRV